MARGADGRVRIGRRDVLAATGGLAVAAALSACTTGGDVTPVPSGSADPDFALRARVYEAEQALLAAYDATLARHPSLRTRLGDIREQHAAHAAAVVVAGDLTASARPPASGAAVPADPAAAVTSLARLETAAAAARAADCLAADRATLARVLSLIGGSEASHAAVLGVGS